MEPIPLELLQLGFSELRTRVALHRVGLSLPLTGNPNLAADFLLQNMDRPDSWWDEQARHIPSHVMVAPPSYASHFRDDVAEQPSPAQSPRQEPHPQPLPERGPHPDLPFEPESEPEPEPELEPQLGSGSEFQVAWLADSAEVGVPPPPFGPPAARPTRMAAADAPSAPDLEAQETIQQLQQALLAAQDKERLQAEEHEHQQQLAEQLARRLAMEQTAKEVLQQAVDAKESELTQLSQEKAQVEKRWHRENRQLRTAREEEQAAREHAARMQEQAAADRATLEETAAELERRGDHLSYPAYWADFAEGETRKMVELVGRVEPELKAECDRLVARFIQQGAPIGGNAGNVVSLKRIQDSVAWGRYQCQRGMLERLARNAGNANERGKYRAKESQAFPCIRDC
jgi:chemotaxis protein histidine kinase CheA